MRARASRILFFETKKKDVLTPFAELCELLHLHLRRPPRPHNQPVTDTNVAHAFDGWNLRDHRCLESIGRSGEEAECWNRGLFADFWQGEMGSKLECVSVLIPVPLSTPIVF